MLARVRQRLLRHAKGDRALLGLRLMLEAIVEPTPDPGLGSDLGEQPVHGRGESLAVDLVRDEAGDEPTYRADRVAHAGLELHHHDRIVWPTVRLPELPQPQQHDDHGLQGAVVDLAGDPSALVLLDRRDVRDHPAARCDARARRRIALLERGACLVEGHGRPARLSSALTGLATVMRHLPAETSAGGWLGQGPSMARCRRSPRIRARR